MDVQIKSLQDTIFLFSTPEPARK